MSKMHTKTIQKIQKAYIKTYEKNVKIYKDIENSLGEFFFFFAHTGQISDFRQFPVVVGSQISQ